MTKSYINTGLCVLMVNRVPWGAAALLGRFWPTQPLNVQILVFGETPVLFIQLQFRAVVHALPSPQSMSDTSQPCILRCPEQSPLQRALMTAQTLQTRGHNTEMRWCSQMETIPQIWCAYTSVTVLMITAVEQSALTKWTTDSVITWEGASPESSSPPVPQRLIQK